MIIAFVIPTIKTPMQLKALAMQTYLFGAAAGLIFLLVAAIIAFLIKYEGGSNNKDEGTRRTWFWLLLIASFAAFFLYHMFIVSKKVAPNLQSKFMITNVTGTVICLLTYFIVGFMVSKVFATSKLGNWFPRKIK
jgi:hypothetical protein